jgi:hypothetical protein
MRLLLKVKKLKKGLSNLQTNPVKVSGVAKSSCILLPYLRQYITYCRALIQRNHSHKIWKIGCAGLCIRIICLQDVESI